jgi:S1-C subfamily serine protease
VAGQGHALGGPAGTGFGDRGREAASREERCGLSIHSSLVADGFFHANVEPNSAAGATPTCDAALFRPGHAFLNLFANALEVWTGPVRVPGIVISGRHEAGEASVAGARSIRLFPKPVKDAELRSVVESVDGRTITLGQPHSVLLVGTGIAPLLSLGQEQDCEDLFRTEMSMSSYEEPAVPHSTWGGCLLLLVLLVLAVGGSMLIWRLWPERSGLSQQAQSRAVTPRGNLSELEKTNIEIYKETAPCLVQVTNLSEQRVDWFSLDVQDVPQGVGSGFIWDKDGHIVTNYHVVGGADAAQVTLADHSTYDARQIWAYPDQDIAVVWINAPPDKLHPILIGTSHDLKVGQITYALGDPFGLDQTMTTGIVSALGRTIQSATKRPIHGVIQTSAAINPGNSGGPLLDSAGRLIGMNTSILSPSGAFAGIGFAIPVDDINRVLPQLIQHGKVVHPRLGAQFAADEVARHQGVEHGALIVKVVPGSAAAKANLRGTGRDQAGHIRLGDVVVAIDGKPVETGEDLHSALQGYKVGDTVALTIIRDGQRQDVQVTLDGGG